MTHMFQKELLIIASLTITTWLYGLGFVSFTKLLMNGSGMMKGDFRRCICWEWNAFRFLVFDLGGIDGPFVSTTAVRGKVQ